jgi:hypothetical protein
VLAGDMRGVLCTLHHVQLTARHITRTCRSTHIDVLMKQEEAGPWPSATEGGEQQAVPAGATSAAAAAASRNQRYPLCSRIADASGASGGQKAGSSEQEHAASALELTGKRLGWGKCGGVNVGWCAPNGG